MTSSRADGTLSGARLISPASRKLWNTGPSSVSNCPVSGRHTRVPTRSAGARSGVDWLRPEGPPSEAARVLTVSVLARPGTPSSSTWPPASRLTSRRSSIASCPTMTRLISWSTSWRASRAWWRCSVAASISVHGSSSGDVSLNDAAEPHQGHGAADQQQREAASGNVRGDLALDLLVSERDGQMRVHRAGLAAVGGREGFAAGALGDVGQLLRA